MSWDALDSLECPYTWDDALYFDDVERGQLLDRLPLSPKNWKRMLDLLRVAYSEAMDYEFAKAKLHLKAAYTTILEPFGDLYVCGVCICYREAIRHVLDATWAFVLDIEHQDEEDDFEEGSVWRESPDGQALCKFIEGITPKAKFDYRQRAAIYAIRAHFTLEPENLSWIQKAIHLSPAEAQWYIDLSYMRWDEDPTVPHLPYPDVVDANLVTKTMSLIESHNCPSKSVKGSIDDRLSCIMDDIARALELKKGSNQRKIFERDCPDETWVLDMELFRLMGRTIDIMREVPGFSGVRCTKKCTKQGKNKKCHCLPEVIQGMLSYMMMGNSYAAMHSPVKPALAPVPVYPMLQASLIQQVGGDLVAARIGLQKICDMAPNCQYAHMRLAVALATRPNSLNDKKAAARAVEHAERCERFYPDVMDFVLESIEAARERAAGPAKPTLSIRKAGRRW